MLKTDSDDHHEDTRDLNRIAIANIQETHNTESNEAQKTDGTRRNNSRRVDVM